MGDSFEQFQQSPQLEQQENKGHPLSLESNGSTRLPEQQENVEPPTSLESNGSAGLHALEPMIPLRRVVPPRVFYVMVCLVCCANVTALLFVFGKTLIQQPFAPMIIFFAALPAVVAGWQLCHWDATRSQGSNFEDMCSHKDSLLAVYLSMVAPLNAKIYTQANPGIRNVSALREAAWPVAQICQPFTYILASCFFLQFIYIPKNYPESRRVVLGLVAFYFELGTLFFFLFFYWPKGGEVGAIADNGNVWLPVQALLLIETARFLHKGDWQGTPVLAIFQLDWLMGLGLWEPVGGSALSYLWDPARQCYSHGLLVGMAIGQMLLLLFAVRFSPKPHLRISRLHNSHQSFDGNLPSIILPESAWKRRVKLSMSSFVGQNLMFMTNGLYSFILYTSQEAAFKEEMRPNVVLFQSGFSSRFDTSRLIKCTWILSMLSVVVAAYNICVELCKGRVINKISSIIPHDSQFRLLTFLKGNMVRLKITILAFTDLSSAPMRVFITQFIAIVTSIGVIGFGIYTTLSKFKAALRSPKFHSKYRSSKITLACIVAAEMCIQFLAMVLIVGKLSGYAWGNDSSFFAAMRQVSPDVMVSLISYFTILWMCFLNEFTCHVRGIGLCLWLATPHATYSVSMPTGLRALAANVASFPAIVFMNTMLNCTPQRLGNMLTGYPFGGYVSTWAAPVVTYASLLLCGVGFAAHWACGPPGQTEEPAVSLSSSLNAESL